MISVIVPIYNSEKHLNKCVDSILNQTYKDLEIILIDDGSTDNSPKICDEYAKNDNRIKVIHKENGGLSSARNAGLKIATGEYITFVDSDDYIDVTMYEKMHASIKKPNADICMCGSKTVDKNCKEIARDILPDDCLFTGEDIILNFVIKLKTAVWNKLFRYEIVKNIHFPPGRVHGEDLVFLSMFLDKTTTMSTVSDACYFYFKRQNSITTSRFSERAFDEIYCKDISRENFVNTFPEYSQLFLVWPFKARMNILRKIITTCPEKYKKTQKDYTEYILLNQKKVFKYLSRKEKSEQILFRLLPLSIFKMLIKAIM